MRLFLHTCCAVCLAGVADDLRGRDVTFTAFFYNPNVHPLIEFRRRLKATQVLCEREAIPLEADESYGLVAFLRAVVSREEAPARCEICYRDRLTRTAEEAKARGFDAFSTTLLASAEQDVGLIRRIADEVSAETGVAFLDADWRAAHEVGKNLARRMSLYRQQYCGCVYSEYDRYRDTGEHLYRPGDKGPGRTTGSGE
ncbi:MAG TPA: epoxyqueuosine reductase QueH [Planctomycetota bacterium]|nr:epoxyqueuosine reductase QueH [Planctomycetota bacterium]